MYRVGPGDTLVGVARQFAVDIDDVARDNKLETDDKLKEGALLRLRVRRDVVNAPAPAAGDEPLKEREADKAKARKDEPEGRPQRRREREAPELKPEKKDRGAQAPGRAHRERRPT
jgi:membrane-bound lytic murein transglycosylase D